MHSLNFNLDRLLRLNCHLIHTVKCSQNSYHKKATLNSRRTIPSLSTSARKEKSHLPACQLRRKLNVLSNRSLRSLNEYRSPGVLRDVHTRLESLLLSTGTKYRRVRGGNYFVSL